MCEIVLLYYLQKQIGETVERSGRDSTLIRILFVVSWIVAEILGLIVGFAITDNGIGAGIFALIAVVTVVVVFLIVAHSLPDGDRTRRGRQRTYMDDYYEYGKSGRVDTRPEPGDPEEEEERPRRRRERRDEDDRDLPRQDEERIRRNEERGRDEPRERRRRPLREDEDY